MRHEGCIELKGSRNEKKGRGYSKSSFLLPEKERRETRGGKSTDAGRLKSVRGCLRNAIAIGRRQIRLVADLEEMS